MTEVKDYENFKTGFNEKVSNADRVVITSHIDPDGDAISSMMAVAQYIKENFPDTPIRLVVSDPPIVLGEVYRNIFPLYDEIEFVPDMADEIQDGDTVVFTDGNALERFTEKPERFDQIPIINIDHHPGKQIVSDTSVVDTSASSTAQVILEVLLADEKDISPEMAKILLLGILADTGFLTYVDDAKHRNMVARLCEFGGVEYEEFSRELRELPELSAKMLEEYKMNEQVVQFRNTNWPDAFISYLPDIYDEDVLVYANPAKDEFLLDQFQRVKTEVETQGQSDLPRWGFVIRPKGDNLFSISFRGKTGGANVRSVVDSLKKMGILRSGGGHPVSSSGMFNTNGQRYTPEEVIEIVAGAIEEFDPVIIQ